MYEHTSLQWRPNGRDSVSNHQPHDCLLNCLFRRRWKKASKLRVTGHCAGNSPGTGEFPAQMASNAEMFPFDDVIMLRSPKWQPRWAMLQNMTRVRRFIIHSLKDPCIPLTTMRHIYGIVLITWSLAIFHQISSTILNDVICPTRSFPLFRIRSYCLRAPPVIFIDLLSVRISRHQINYPIGCLANKTKSIDSYRDICILSSTSHSMRMYIFINIVNTLWQHCACYPINLLIRIMYTPFKLHLLSKVLPIFVGHFLTFNLDSVSDP